MRSRAWIGDLPPARGPPLAGDSDLADELGVGGERGLAAPRLHTVGLPRPGHRRVIDPQPGRQKPARPVRHLQLIRRRAARRLHDLPVVDGLRPPRPLRVRLRREPIAGIPRPPKPDRGHRHPHLPGHLHVEAPVSGQQHDPSPLRQPRPDRRGPQPPTQILPIPGPQAKSRYPHHFLSHHTTKRLQRHAASCATERLITSCPHRPPNRLHLRSRCRRLAPAGSCGYEHRSC